MKTFIGQDCEVCKQDFKAGDKVTVIYNGTVEINDGDTEIDDNTSKILVKHSKCPSIQVTK